MPTVKDLMTAGPISVDPDESVEKAILLMLKHGLSGLPVTDTAGRLLGIISEFDLLDLIWDAKTVLDKVYQHMTREVRTAHEDDELTTAAELFRTLSIRRLPVVRDHRLVGILSRGDLLRHVLQTRGQRAPVTPRLLCPSNVPLQNPAGI